MNKIVYLLIVGACAISILTACNNQGDVVEIQSETNVISEEVVAIEVTEVAEIAEVVEVAEVAEVIEVVEESKNTKQYEVAGINDSEKFNNLFISIQEALESENKELIADSILYPLKVNTKDERFKIGDKEAFLRNYDEIFTDKVKNALSNQIIDELFVNYQGIMVGDGEIWFSCLEDPQYGIITINIF